MSESTQPDDTSGTAAESNTEQLTAVINRAQGHVQSLKQDLTPHLTREIGYLETDLEILESWNNDASEEGIEALAGAKTIAETGQARFAYLEEEIGQASEGLRQRLDNLEEELNTLVEIVDSLEITTTVYVTYVDRQFAERYFDPEQRISTVLEDSGREDVDELGLYPLDGLFGEAIPDLAFPSNKTVDLSDDHRVYWEVETDGGNIAAAVELYDELSSSCQEGFEILQERRPEAEIVAIHGDWAYISVGRVDVGRITTVFEQEQALGIVRIPNNFPNGPAPYGIITVPYLTCKDDQSVKKQEKSDKKARPVEQALEPESLGFWSWKWNEVSNTEPSDLKKAPDLIRERLRMEE